MNLVETYVTNITDVQEIKTEWEKTEIKRKGGGQGE